MLFGQSLEMEQELVKQGMDATVATQAPASAGRRGPAQAVQRRPTNLQQVAQQSRRAVQRNLAQRRRNAQRRAPPPQPQPPQQQPAKKPTLLSLMFGARKPAMLAPPAPPATLPRRPVAPRPAPTSARRPVSDIYSHGKVDPSRIDAAREDAFRRARLREKK